MPYINAKVQVLYEDRESALSEGGVYTEYSMASTASTSDLPTDCRTGSFAYQQSSGKLYRFDNNGTWGEVGA